MLPIAGTGPTFGGRWGRVAFPSVERLPVAPRFLSGCLLAGSIALALLAPVAAPAQDSPTAVVERFHADLLGVMKNAKTLGYRGRLAVLTTTIQDVFHLPAMTRLVAGRSRWKSFSQAQKRAFIDAFSTTTRATYARRFDGYSGERFDTLQTVPVRSKTMLVKTSLTTGAGEVIRLNYLLRRFRGGWRVIDVYLKGTISELATKRSEYSSVLRREGFEGLLARIRDKVASLEASAAGN